MTTVIVGAGQVAAAVDVIDEIGADRCLVTAATVLVADHGPG